MGKDKILPLPEAQQRRQDAKNELARLEVLKQTAPPGIDMDALKRRMTELKMQAHSGRARALTDPVDLRQRIEAYFGEHQVDIAGESSRQTKPITVTGLCNAIGINSRSLYRYMSNNDEIGMMLQAAYNAIQEMYEARVVYSDKPVGTIFALKNMFGWKDNVDISYTEQRRVMTEDEINAIADADVVDV